MLLGCEVLLFDFFPGFNRFEFTVIGYIKKVEDPSIPTYQFAIMNGDFLLQVPIFSDEDIRNCAGKSIQINTPTIPTPFDNDCHLGKKQHYRIQIKDDSVTPNSTMCITVKYDNKIEVKQDK